MKKATLLLFIFLISVSGFAQLALESFEGTFPPNNWLIINNGGPNITWVHNQVGNPQQPAHTGDRAAYLNREISGTGITEDWLVTPGFPAPANAQLRFWSRLSIPGNQGTIYEIRVSTNPIQNDTDEYTVVQTWTETQINPSQETYTEKLVNLTGITAGQQIYVAFVMRGTSNNGDRWLVDDVQVVERCLEPTTLTASNIAQTTANLSWGNPSGATSWEIEVVPVASAPTGLPPGAVTYSGPLPYTATGLTEDTDYKYYVRALCSPTNTSDWVGPFNFSTVPTGATCSAPIVIGTLPFSATGNTSNFGDDFEGTPGATGCGTTGNFLNGDEVVYAYTAAFTGTISVNMTGNGANSAMFVYNSCANIGVSCVAGGTGNATTPVNLPSVSVTAGTTYYIVISSSTTQSTPYNLIIQQVNCPQPTGLTAANVTATSADLSWTAGAATSWEVFVQNAGAGIPAGAGITTTVNTNYNVTQTTAGVPFTSATAYEYYVRADCNNGTFSAWAGPFTFLTTQVPVALNYSENFEGVSGWSLSNGTQTNKWVIGSAVSNGGTNSLYVSNDNGATNAFTITTASTVHAYRDLQFPATVDQVSLSFDWRGVGETCCDYIRVWLVPTSFVPTPGTQITAANSGGVQIGGNLNQSGTWTTANYTINAAAYAGGIRRLVFEWRNDGSVGTQPAGAIDNVNISLITCSAPSALTLSNLGTDQATFTWTAPVSGAASYDYYFSTSNTPPTAATTPSGNVATNTVTLTSLPPSTTYYFWVRSNCGAVNGTSFWIGPVAFNTPQVPATLNFSDGFEGPMQWTLNNGTQTNKWVVGTATANGGTQSLYISNDNGVNNAFTVTSTSTVQAYRDIQMPATVDQLYLSFDWKAVGEGCCDYLRVWLVPVTYTPTPGTQITAAASGGVQLGGNFNQNGTWTTANYTINAAAYAGSIRRLIFEWRNDGSVGTQPPAAVDNINLAVITCPAPSNLALSNLGTDQATFTWNAPASGAPSYDYYLSTSSTAPTAATAPSGNVTATTVTLTDLPPSTTYYFWVRSNCGATDGTSFWIGPVTFNTPQVPGTLPYTETFEGAVPFTLVNGTQTNKWVVGTATSNGGTHSLYISNDNGVSNAFSITSTSTVHAYRDLAIPATAGEISVSFDWKAVGEGCCDYIRVWLVPVTFTPTPGTLITAAASGGVQLGGNLNQNATWTTANFDVSATGFAGTTRRLIFEWRNDGSVGTQPPGAIDNVNVSVITCPKPVTLTATAITQTSATLGWTEAGAATSWEVYYGVSGATTPPTASTTGTVVTTNSMPVTGLSSGTTYVFYVRALCGGTDGNSNWAGPFTFTALISNDECENAIVAAVNNNSLCTETTPGTLAGATASAQANGCAGTADDDVWFEFTATSTQHYIALLNAAGQAVTGDNMVHAVYSGDQCGSLTQLYCSDTNNSIANNLVVGQTYKLRVFSNASTPQTFNFRVCIGIILTCADSDPFCANAEQTGETFPGSVGVPNLGTVSCLFTTPNPTYYFLQIAGSGNLQLNISQTSTAGTPIDVDFIAYGPFASLDNGCLNLTAANEVDCSYSAAAVEPFSIPNAIAGEYYIVMITNFNGSAGTINFSQTNIGAPGSGVTDCTIVCTANLGPDQVLCGVTEYDLDANIINADSYTWFLNGEVIPGATQQTYTATQSGTYSVEVIKATCPTNPTDSMELTLIPTLDVPDPAQVTACGNAGTGSVDLSTLGTTILGTLDPADYVVEYYPTQADANAGTNQIDTSVPFVTSSQTIYVRIESALLDTCFDVVPLPIVVNTSADAEIVYADSPYCSNETTGTVTLTGDTGGTFTSTAGLVIDPATGTIDIAASTAGAYTVTYAIAATPFCPPFSDTFDVVIVEAPAATISYSGSPYCSDGGTATVTQTGTTGGTYSSTAGLVIDPVTGDIDLAASTAGTYTVTYTVPATADCAPAPFTTQVTITALPVATIDYGTAPYCSNGGTVTVTQTGAAGGTYTSAAGLVIDAATGAIDLDASTAGTYTVTYAIPGGSGCTPDPVTASITITALPVATFTYDSASYCVNFPTTVAPSLGTGAVAGTFTVNQPGLTIDPLTGQIDPATSTPGVYEVTNTVAAANGCPAVPSLPFEVTIIAAPIPDFSYSQAAYCQEELTVPSPIFTTGEAGTFSAAPAGLVIDPSTGVIDLSASQPGTYQVKNTIAATADCGVAFDEQTVVINATPIFVFSEGCDGNTFKLEVVDLEDSFETDDAVYVWTGPLGFTPPAFNTAEIEPTVIGDYTVTVTTPDGCTNTLPFNVESTSCLIQKGISPGDSDKNNTFDLTALGVTRISIFNRYGQEVYSYGAYTNQWSGQDKHGNELPTGTYFYSFERSNGETKTGWIYVNRQN